MREKPRIVLDINLFVSAFISPAGTPSQLLDICVQGRVILLASVEFLGEVEDVLHRDYIKQRYQVAEQRIREFLADLRVTTEPVIPLLDLPLHSRDPKDDNLLSLALGGSADYLITGDADLLVLNDHPALGSLRIITQTATRLFTVGGILPLEGLLRPLRCFGLSSSGHDGDERAGARAEW